LVLLYYFTYIDDAQSNTNQIFLNLFCICIYLCIRVTFEIGRITLVRFCLWSHIYHRFLYWLFF